MNQARMLLLWAAVISTVIILGWSTKSAPGAGKAQQAPAQQAPTTVAATVDRDITAVEKLVVEAAEAMPEEKFNFSPENLNLRGSEYKGVRTFAVQVKHIATSNYFIWSTLTGEKVPEELKDGNSPEALKTKAEIIAFLKTSFALGNRATATLTTQNMLQPVGSGNFTRLFPCDFWCGARLRSLRTGRKPSSCGTTSATS